MQLTGGRIGIALVMMAGCAQPGSRTVSGQLDLSQVTLVNASVVAISSTGKVRVAPISASGAFSITVPTGEAHTLRFANATANPRLHDSFGVLRLGNGSHWFSLGSGGAIALGRVGRPGVAPAAASGLGTASESDDGGETGDGTGEKEDDDSSTCDLERGGDQAELEAEHDLAAGGGASAVADDDGQEADSDEERACTASAGDAAPTAPVNGIRAQ